MHSRTFLSYKDILVKVLAHAFSPLLESYPHFWEKLKYGWMHVSSPETKESCMQKVTMGMSLFFFTSFLWSRFRWEIPYILIVKPKLSFKGGFSFFFFICMIPFIFLLVNIFSVKGRISKFEPDPIQNLPEGNLIL